MKVDISRLLSVSNYAKQHDVSPSYIYRLIREQRMSSLVISDVHFIDVIDYPSIPVINRRK